MNDQELARQIVAHLGGDGPNNYAAYSIVIDELSHWMPAEKFVRNWLVAGAMMEKIGKICVGACESCILVHVDDNQTQEFSIESLPRAINEACCQVL